MFTMIWTRGLEGLAGATGDSTGTEGTSGVMGIMGTASLSAATTGVRPAGTLMTVKVYKNMKTVNYYLMPSFKPRRKTTGYSKFHDSVSVSVCGIVGPELMN